MQTMQEAFAAHTVAELKTFVALFPNMPKPPPTRKDQLLSLVLAEMADEKLPSLWERLNEALQMAIAEACYNTGGVHIPISPRKKTLLSLWKKWLRSSILDEFSRIEAIKGQKSSGRVMSVVPARREALQEALMLCPVNL